MEVSTLIIISLLGKINNYNNTSSIYKLFNNIVINLKKLRYYFLFNIKTDISIFNKTFKKIKDSNNSIKFKLNIVDYVNNSIKINKKMYINDLYYIFDNYFLVKVNDFKSLDSIKTT